VDRGTGDRPDGVRVPGLFRRWLAFKADPPSSGRLDPDLVQAWLGSLPPATQKLGRAALRHGYGPRALFWEDIRLRRYRRDEARLHRSLLSTEERARLRHAVASHPRERAIVECFWTLRRAEVAALRWDDLDLPRGLAYVRTGKGDKPAVTLLPAETCAALTAWYQASGDPPPGSPVFPSDQRGTRPTPAGHLTAYALGEQARVFLQRLVFWRSGTGVSHRFRRTFATEYLRANPQDLEGLRRLMRHDDIATTVRYVYFNENDLAQRLGRVAL
jgi:integrase